jgi:hypothetical protein
MEFGSDRLSCIFLMSYRRKRRTQRTGLRFRLDARHRAPSPFVEEDSSHENMILACQHTAVGSVSSCSQLNGYLSHRLHAPAESNGVELSAARTGAHYCPAGTGVAWFAGLCGGACEAFRPSR